MGICAACVTPPKRDGEVKTSGDEVEKKMRPYLFQLEQEFLENAGDDQVLDLRELATIWKKAAKKKEGKLSEQEAVMIEEAARAMIERMDVDGSGTISYHEFVTHGMGGLESRGNLRGMRKGLTAALKKDPQFLQKLVTMFKAWDKNGDGFVTPDELDAHIAQLLREGGLESNLGVVERLKEELLAVADVNSDGKVDLWELMAWAMGRRKQPVELLLYDISKGATEWAGPLLFGRFDVEAFHSATHVYGSEYWYGGKVFRTEPPCEKQFGKPIRQSPALKLEPSEVRPDLYVVRLGYTFVTHDEFIRFLQEKCIERYTGIEKYDLLTHSCNHFSDECCHFLLGRGLPDHVLELQRMALTPAVASLRPFLNRHLGGFSEQGGGGDQLLEDSAIEARAQTLAPQELLGPGAVVLVDCGLAGIGPEGEHVIATIVEEKKDLVRITFFDHTEQKISTRANVPTKAILKRIEH